MFINVSFLIYCITTTAFPSSHFVVCPECQHSGKIRKQSEKPSAFAVSKVLWLQLAAPVCLAIEERLQEVPLDIGTERTVQCVAWEQYCVHSPRRSRHRTHPQGWARRIKRSSTACSAAAAELVLNPFS